MIRKSIITIVLLIFVTVSMKAENNKTNNLKQKSVIKELKKNKNNGLEEAMKLLEEMNLESVYKNAVKNSTNRILRANPKYKKVEEKIKKFYEKYIGWSVMKKDLAKLYAKYFTPQELKELTNFYRTKTGKKVLATMSKLAYEGQMLTRKKLMSHMNELQKILDSALKNNKKAVSKASTK